ncbi:hypothetical protein P7D71_21755, partial [Enterococcus raffinosus]|nr:hypothetical protein [Enterococcus raffinosus]
MTKLVQLKENGEYKYIKTHVEGIDGIDGALVRADGDESIGGSKNFADSLNVKGKRVLTSDDLP